MPNIRYGNAATIIVFVTPDCPIVNGSAPEIARIASEFSGRETPFYAVYVDPETTLAAARAHARAFGPVVQVVLDPRQELVRRMRVEVTPEAVLFDRSRNIRYRGRIDDRYPRLGLRRATVTRHDLRDALRAVLERKTVSNPTAPAVGCLIPRLRR